MAYYVLGPGGSKYGPAELNTLNEWIAQGRISPETLLEDSGSGTKTPARAVRGLQFDGNISQGSPPPLAGSIPPLTHPANTPLAGTQYNQVSTCMPPGLSSSGGNHNLFLPGVDAKWAAHGILSACGGLALGLVLRVVATAFPHFDYYSIRLMILSLGLCIYGIKCGSNGIKRGESGRGALVIAVNILAFLASMGVMAWGFLS